MCATWADTDQAFQKLMNSCSAGGYGGAAGTGAQTGALGAGGYGAGKSFFKIIQGHLFARLQVCRIM